MHNVFLPIQVDGKPATLAVKSGRGSGCLGDLGYTLWRGTKGIETQIRLCGLFGGELPFILPDGTFDEWADSTFFVHDRTVSRMLAHPGFSKVAPEDLTTWLTDAREGLFSPKLLSILESIPIQQRMDGKLHLGDGDAKIFQTPLPLNRHAFETASKMEIPMAFGEQSAGLIADYLQHIDFNREVDHIDEALEFDDRYLFAQGRWMTALPIGDMPFQGKKRHAVWIPITQALAMDNLGQYGFGAMGQDLKVGATEIDLADIIALSRVVHPDLLYQGDPEAASWIQEMELQALISTKQPSRALPRL